MSASVIWICYCLCILVAMMVDCFVFIREKDDKM